MIFGAVVGDVIGSPYEFNRNNIKTKNFELISERSQFTDDSVMTVAISHALCECKTDGIMDEKKFKKAVIESMQYFGRRYPYAGYGTMFIGWVFSEHPRPYNSFGNGSAMRVSPIAWAFDDLETVEKFAEISASVSHNHPEGIKGAQAIAAAIFMARTGKSKSEIKNYIENKYHYNLDRTCDEIRPFYHHIETCQETVPEAITAFLEGENFEDAVRTAVSLGGDSDTLTDITASIAQGMWGVPEEIEKMIRSKLDDFMLFEIDKFYELFANTAKKIN